MQVGKDVIRHFLIILLNLGLFIEQCGRAVLHRMEQVGARPVKDRHKVVGYDLNSELCQIPQGNLVVLDILIAGRQTNFDIIVYIDALNNIHIEACVLNLLACLFDLLDRPDLARLLIMKCPNQSGYTRDLFNLLRRNAVISCAVPAECHLHINASFYATNFKPFFRLYLSKKQFYLQNGSAAEIF